MASRGSHYRLAETAPREASGRSLSLTSRGTDLAPVPAGVHPPDPILGSRHPRTAIGRDRRAIVDLLVVPDRRRQDGGLSRLAAYAMAIRRLQGQSGRLGWERGLSVIMRYTLEISSLLQQFQRASTLICADGGVPRGDAKHGARRPSRSAYGSGSRVTPNRTEDATRPLKRRTD